MTDTKSEFALIDAIRRLATTSHPDVIVGIGDDMAVMRVGGEKLLVTTDMLLEGVHFDLSRSTLEQVGYKSMACSLSDCAAMAALPFVAVVAVALPRTMSMSDAQLLHRGLEQAAAQYHCPLVGGDTTSWDKPLAINVTMLASTSGTEPVLRSGAQPGDAILVTGELGGSLRGRHLSFTPRVNEAQTLIHLARLHAMIDLSDGLSSDLRHICEESQVAAVIDAAAIPVSSAAKTAPDPLAAALADGEDFELLFCVSPVDADNLLNVWPQHSSLRLTRIGQIMTPQSAPSPDARVFLRSADGALQPLTLKGWEHFHD